MPTELPDDALGASYRLTELIGRGAAGEVWRAVDRRTEETVAAKLLRAEHVEDDDLVDRFLRERSILTRLRHESVVAVRDLVVEGDRLAIVMEYVDGGSLRDALRARSPLTPALALGVAAAVLDGLAAAHDQQVLHRDVKPDNVLLSTSWQELAPGAVKVSDFGIARIVAGRTSSSTGLVGTPEYMAPEQLVTGDGGLPSDVYGAGILLYELLAGRTPFAGVGTGYTVAHRHVTSLPPRLPVPDPVWELLGELLNKDPSRRPTAREAAVRVRALCADVADLSALAAQQVPSGFASAGGPATELRGLVPPADEPAAEPAPDDPEPGAGAPEGEPPAGKAPLPDLGTGTQETMLRSMPTVPVPTARPKTRAPQTDRRPPWRDPRAIALVAAGLLLIGGGIFWVTRAGSTPVADDPPSAAVIRALQQGEVKKTGLGITREAVWDPQSKSVRLTITYSAQRSTLGGPFLEVVPGIGEGAACPSVQWPSVRAVLNSSVETGISAPCAWSVRPADAVPAQGSTQVAATVALALPATGADTALQEWLDAAAAATEAATSDGEVTSTAYPAQRLTGISVVAPPRTVSGKTLTISLLPVWPNGADELHPLFRSPPDGDPSSMLVAVAGGDTGIRFTDNCSGALSISRDGLSAVALSVAENCEVGARVGNFTDLASNAFSIATRGS